MLPGAAFISVLSETTTGLMPEGVFILIIRNLKLFSEPLKFRLKTFPAFPAKKRIRTALELTDRISGLSILSLLKITEAGFAFFFTSVLVVL